MKNTLLSLSGIVGIKKTNYLNLQDPSDFTGDYQGPDSDRFKTAWSWAVVCTGDLYVPTASLPAQ